ncbi:MAG: RNA polymerase sigma factor [Alloprevotella sp.]
MPSQQIYTEDLKIAQAIIQRDAQQTRDFMHRKCYPLFKSIFDNYHTDCESVTEFINDIYVLILTPSQETGRCQLQNFRGESTLATWMKTACLFHCYHKFKKRIHVVEIFPASDEDDEDAADRFMDQVNSTTIDSSSIERLDLEVILSLMPNERYRELIRLRYVEEKSNEETAEALGMTMANYYNKHKLAKEQFARTLKSEDFHAKQQQSESHQH